MKGNDKVLIIPSKELKEIQLSPLAGQTGLIVEDLAFNGRKNKGYMIMLDEEYLGESIWFIPAQSIQYEK
ncbi:hypothetical protein D0T56_15035 [Dysgonomonas sp. 520]|nr:hypothetical protein [Dysgonomonas sp. 520]